MPPLSDKQLEERLTAAGKSIANPPTSADELLPLLDVSPRPLLILLSTFRFYFLLRLLIILIMEFTAFMHCSARFSELLPSHILYFVNCPPLTGIKIYVDAKFVFHLLHYHDFMLFSLLKLIWLSVCRLISASTFFVLPTMSMSLLILLTYGKHFFL